jgi:hypothetical protein
MNGIFRISQNLKNRDKHILKSPFGFYKRKRIKTSKNSCFSSSSFRKIRLFQLRNGIKNETYSWTIMLEIETDRSK